MSSVYIKPRRKFDYETDSSESASSEDWKDRRREKQQPRASPPHLCPPSPRPVPPHLEVGWEGWFVMEGRRRCVHRTRTRGKENHKLFTRYTRHTKIVFEPLYWCHFVFFFGGGMGADMDLTAVPDHKSNYNYRLEREIKWREKMVHQVSQIIDHKLAQWSANHKAREREH